MSNEELNSDIDRMMSFTDKQTGQRRPSVSSASASSLDSEAGLYMPESDLSTSARMPSERSDMELIDYINVFSRRKWVILTTLFFTLIIVALWVTQSPKQYTASALVRISTPRSGSAEYVDYNTTLAERIINTYVQLATSQSVLQELYRSVDRVLIVNAQALPNTELFEITVQDSDPALAQFAANRVAEISISQGSAIIQDAVTPIDTYIAQPASLPVKPSSANPWLVVALGVVIGLLGGIALAFVFESLDTRLYSDKQIEAFLQQLVIGNIPDGKDPAEDGLSLFSNNIYHEAFRRLRTNIFSPIKNRNIKSLLVTSAVPKDGKSSVAANLAMSISQSNRSVLVIDANLRYPSLHKFFNLTNEHGLTDLLKGELKVSDVLQDTKQEKLKVITSGPSVNNPVETLDSSRMKEIIQEMSKQFDVVLVDSPASASVTDSAVLSPMVDGVLLVVRHAWVRREVLQSTRRNLETVGANIIGVVSNKTDLGTRGRSSHHA